jgi:hypothetical protein
MSLGVPLTMRRIRNKPGVVFAGPVATTAIRDFGLLRKGEG